MSAIQTYQGSLPNWSTDLYTAQPPDYSTGAASETALLEEPRPGSGLSPFIVAVEQSFANYREFGPRSTKKLLPLHAFFADRLRVIWGNPFKVQFMGSGSREMTVNGKYYPKDIDITVTHAGTPVFCLGIKFITSNYKQNANNYFENMMGETANIQAVGSLPYAHFIILRQKTPYYAKNDFVTPQKIEVINDKDIQKYVNLMRDARQAHRPDYLGIQLINLDERSGRVTLTNASSAFSPHIARVLSGLLSMQGFFSGIRDFKDLYNTDKQ